MATQYVPNYALDTTTANNSFSAIWKLTRAIKAAGATYKASGDGTNKDTTGVATSDLWGGNANPLADSYPASQLDSRAAWWCAELVSTVKLGIGGPSTGTFIRGEVVTQAVTGATGEMLGYVINAAGTSGWMVILPQTGTFNSTNQITGGVSGATITPTSYNLVRRQIVIAKNTTVTTGWIFYEALTDSEIAASSNTALFSDLAANAANCTATVAPGNSSSGSNRFPSYGIASIGAAEGAGNAFFGASTNFGKAQIAAVNSVGSAGVSPDGSYFCAIWDATQSQYRYISFQRLDDSEPGDVDPFAITAYTSESPTVTTSRTIGTATSASQSWANAYSTNATSAKGYCARTIGTMGTGIDSYSPFVFGSVSHGGSSVPAQACNAASVPRIRNHPDNAGTPPYPIEPASLTGIVTNLTMRKGVCRWIGYIPTGAMNDTADAKRWLVVLAASGTSNPSVVIGPYDGSTTPVTT